MCLHIVENKETLNVTVQTMCVWSIIEVRSYNHR